MIATLSMWACLPAPPEPTCPPPEGEHLLVATTDFEVGALAVVDLETGCVGDSVASVGPDPLLRPLGDLVAVANRSRGDALALYEPGAYERPVAEFVLEVAGNAHDVVQRGDELLVPLYAVPEVVVADLDGVERGRIDLSAHDDGDGNVEADRVVIVGGRPVVALQRLSATGSVWLPAGPGHLVALDVDALAVGEWWEVGTNPRIGPHPGGHDALTLLTGRFFEPDGALYALQPGGDPDELLAEAALGLDLTHAGGVGDRLVVVGVGFELGDRFRVDCLDLVEGDLVPGVETDAWPVDAVAGDDEVYVAVRPNGGRGPSEVWRVDLHSCAVEVLADGLLLPPYALARVR